MSYYHTPKWKGVNIHNNSKVKNIRIKRFKLFFSFRINVFIMFSVAIFLIYLLIPVYFFQIYFQKHFDL